MSWLLAVAPILLLVALVARSRWSTGAKAVLTAAAATVIAAIAFQSGPGVLAVAVGKGLWSGIWILYVVWPALLLYQVGVGAGLDRMGATFANVLPREVENVLLVAWVFPSFIQGVAGFGTPIAMAAPLLLAMGVGPVLAVALPLVGYHWSVTFGSMGSSFYMAAVTANLGPGEQARFAGEAALMLTVNMLLAGMLVCLLHGGVRSLREGARMLAVAGGAMAVVLNLVVRLEPSIGSLAAGAAGLAAVGGLRARSRVGVRAPSRPSTVAAAVGGTAPSLTVLLPYGYLLIAVLAVLVPPASRAFVQDHLLLAPSFPATRTGFGITNEAVAQYTPIALLGHPGTYILLSAVLGYLTYRATGTWADATTGGVLRTWLGKARRSSLSVLALTVLATVMVDSGMVRAIAEGAAGFTGAAFPALSPVIGAVGSFTTGSTTTSNALFAALQHDVADLIGVQPAHLLAAQTVGGNVGNVLAPVVMLIGVTAIDGEEHMDAVFRRVARPAALRTAVTIAATFVLTTTG
ncbi:MAG TPA: L-lactate permease [Euzebya sp.]|nr:L-lactate permease [Euzebya sp.]